MNIIKSGYEILTDISDGGVEELKHIEKIARVCYKSEDKISGDGESAKNMIRALIRSEHLAMLEHSSLSVMFTVNRQITHELVRHRVASFAQESTRYCSYNKDKFGNELTFIDLQPGLIIDGKSGKEVDDILSEWYQACKDAEKHYMKMLELGATPQIAASVLPNSTKATITVTANYREWRHIFALRAVGTTGKPHPQMQEIMIPLLKDVANKIPVVFDDLIEMLK